MLGLVHDILGIWELGCGDFGESLLALDLVRQGDHFLLCM